jgi:molybdopterin/thiamine biosynthesis adenylyltransferase
MSDNKFLHEEIYRGEGLVDKLSKVKIVVCGAGAIGSNLIDNLTRQGFGNLVAIDMDRVEQHNINTQLFGDEDVGALKVDALKNKVFRTVGVEIQTFNKRMDAKNAKKFLKGADLVIDTFDNTESRQMVRDQIQKFKIPCLHCGLFEGYGECVWDEDYTVPKEVPGMDVCEYPLARNIVIMVAVVATEEILSFCLEKKPRFGNWAITLGDMKIQPYR